MSNNFEEQLYDGEYKVFLPEGILGDDEKIKPVVKDVILSIFGEKTKLYFVDDDDKTLVLKRQDIADAEKPAVAPNANSAVKLPNPRLGMPISPARKARQTSTAAPMDTTGLKFGK
jgi:hypothetical protein